MLIFCEGVEVVVPPVWLPLKGYYKIILVFNGR